MEILNKSVATKDCESDKVPLPVNSILFSESFTIRID